MSFVQIPRVTLEANGGHAPCPFKACFAHMFVGTAEFIFFASGANIKAIYF